MDTTFAILIVLIFIAVVFLLEGAYLTWNTYKGPEATRIERRLQAMSAGAHHSESMNLMKERLLSDTKVVQRFLLGIPRAHQLDRILLQSGLKLKVGSFLGLTLACGLATFFLLQLLPLPLLVPVLVGLAGATIPWMVVMRFRHKRLAKFEEQLPDAIDLMCRALRAGHALPQSLKMIGDEMSDPISGEFRTTFDEVNYGFSLQEAMMNLATRIPSTDLRYMVIAVLIQRETGGNLAELLGNISALIRARLKLYGTIRVLAAEGKLSAWILTILPFAVALVIHLLNPGFMKVLWEDQTGLMMVSIIGLMMLAGIFWMRQIIKIQV
ncbi:type II secretion system F family protein [Pseudogulbenkiania ferrooxidans]|uniref:Type II secretion system protein n=1 Tax=Pseudogulbenkiania ferrooxidans 2002 TaxID=279714 RepID=B9YZT0_9NEIS|nr:type II secretion system F family protein [Pseudogulbenkiania ferrooxidans]EEG09813.1 type II secretion system protein [Pseudogulbenkiania ferrooxidans 2002]